MSDTILSVLHKFISLILLSVLRCWSVLLLTLFASEEIKTQMDLGYIENACRTQEV